MPLKKVVFKISIAILIIFFIYNMVWFNIINRENDTTYSIDWPEERLAERNLKKNKNLKCGYTKVPLNNNKLCWNRKIYKLSKNKRPGNIFRFDNYSSEVVTDLIDNFTEQYELNKSTNGPFDEKRVKKRFVETLGIFKIPFKDVYNGHLLKNKARNRITLPATVSSVTERISQAHTSPDMINDVETVAPISNNTSVDNSTEPLSEYEESLRRFQKLWPIHLWKKYGWYKDDYMYRISNHWLQFSPPDSASHYGLAGMYSVIMLVGISANCLVIFMYIKCKTLRTPANILVLNLAISDFIMLSKAPLFIYNSVMQGPALGDACCRIYGFVGGLTGTVSICTLAAIALDRYHVVVYPFEPLRSVSGLRAKLSCLFVWLYGFAFSIVPVLDFGWGAYVPEGYLTSCSFDYMSHDMNEKIFIMCFFCAAWLLPFSIITYSYVNILKVVLSARGIKKNETGSTSSRHCKEKDKRRTELKLTAVVIGVIGLWFVAWTPYAIIALMGVFNAHSLLTPVASMVPALFCKVASCLDPIIYAVTHPRFRNELQNLFLSKAELMRRRNTSRMGSMMSNADASVRRGPRRRFVTQESEDGVEEVVIMTDLPHEEAIDDTVDGDRTTLPPKLLTPRGIGLASVKPLEDGATSLMQVEKPKTGREKILTPAFAKTLDRKFSI